MKKGATAAAILMAASILPFLLDSAASQSLNQPPPGYKSLFNGRDLSGWKIPEGDNGHWKVTDGVIDCDGKSESPNRDKNLWTGIEYSDFELLIDWRLMPSDLKMKAAWIMPDGSRKLDQNGKPIQVEISSVDSGIFLREGKVQLNLWYQPMGSGEIHGYLVDPKLPPEIRAGAYPKVNADKPIGEWNTFKIIMKGERITVILNGKMIIDNSLLPGVVPKGPIGLQMHPYPLPSLAQFRNIFIKEL